jgi:hypothetical protein
VGTAAGREPCALMIEVLTIEALTKQDVKDARAYPS